MRREVAVFKSLSFGLAFMMSVRAFAETGVPITVEGSVGVDGSGIIEGDNVKQVMFNGKTPPHGFQICSEQQLFFSDVGNGPFDNVAYYTMVPVPTTPYACYTTPLGYRPPGPVMIYGNQGATFRARMW
jgi:hypothetical protein